MKTKHLLLSGLIVILASCSSAYRTGQTPDDVYYSPAPVQNVYVTTSNEDERDSYAYNNSNYNNEDMEIRRGIKDIRYRNNVSIGLGYGHGYNPYGYNSYGYNPYGYNSYSYDPFGYSPYGYNSHNGYYNPYANNYGYSGIYATPYYNPYTLNCFPTSYSSYYYSPQVYYSTSGGSVNRTIAPRRYNLGAYTNTPGASAVNREYRPVNTTTTPAAPIRNISSTTRSNSEVTVPATRNTNRGVGNVLRRVFSTDNNNRSNSNNRSNDNNSNNRVYRSESNSNTNTNNNSNSSPVRTTQSSSSVSSGSSSSGSSSAPVRTFRK